MDGETLAMVINDDKKGITDVGALSLSIMTDRGGESIVDVFKLFRRWAFRQQGSKMKGPTEA